MVLHFEANPMEFKHLNWNAAILSAKADVNLCKFIATIFYYLIINYCCCCFLLRDYVTLKQGLRLLKNVPPCEVI